MKSTSLEAKLSSRLEKAMPGVYEQDNTVQELSMLLELATAPSIFHSQSDFANHLTEGALLHVSILGSKALAIPYGEYMVLNIDDRQAVLVPTAPAADLHREAAERREVLTKDLLGSWSKMQRVLREYGAEPQGFAGTPAADTEKDGAEKQQEAETAHQSSDSPNELSKATDLRQLFDAMPQSQAEIARDIGVAEPSIGRWTAPEGHPSHRTPTVAHIKRIADKTGVGACTILNMALNQLSGGSKKRKGNSRSGSRGGTAWGGQ